MTYQKLLARLAAYGCCGALAATVAVGQTARAGKKPAPAAGTAAAAAATTQTRPTIIVPNADALMYVDVKRVLTDILPRVLAGNPAKLKQVNADVDQFKLQTGIDPRAFERVTVSMRFVNPTPETTKVESVAVANGTFSAGAMVAAGKMAAQGKYREEKFQDKTIYVFSLDQQIKLFGLIKANVGELAVAALDANTLAVGSPATVRSVIETPTPGGDLMAMASQNPQALAGFGGNLPASVTQNLDLGNEEIARNVAAIRQFYGSVSATGAGYEMQTVLRTETPDSARNLGDTLAALKQFAPLVSLRLRGPQAKIAQTALENLQITNRNNEVELKGSLAEADLTTLLGGT